jgi:hypothetical protein
LIFNTCCIMKIITSAARNEVSRPRVQWLVFSICSVLSYYNDSENPKMSKHGTAGKRKHNINNSCSVTWSIECGESRSVTVASYNTWLSTLYDVNKQNGQLRLIVAYEKVKDIFTWHALKLPKLVHLDKVLHKWFTALCVCLWGGGGDQWTNKQTNPETGQW